MYVPFETMVSLFLTIMSGTIPPRAYLVAAVVFVVDCWVVKAAHALFVNQELLLSSSLSALWLRRYCPTQTVRLSTCV